MKTYLVVDIERADEFYTVNDLNELISEMYECELLEGNSFDVVKGWFFKNYKVFVSDNNIEEVVN
jgi:hypothetical protein